MSRETIVFLRVGVIAGVVTGVTSISFPSLHLEGWHGLPLIVLSVAVVAFLDPAHRRLRAARRSDNDS